MYRILAIAALALLSAACATKYGKYGIGGGYTDARIDENTFSVSVNANGYTKLQTASMHALYRAAELTLENGFDFFVVISDENNSRSGSLVIPGSSISNTTVNAYGSNAYATTTTTHTPATIVPMVFPNSTLTIKSFKGNKQEGAPNAYDARSVIKYLGPQIGVEEKKK